MSPDTQIEVIPASQVHRKAKGTYVMVDRELHEHFKGPGHEQRAEARAASLRAKREHSKQP